MSKMFRSRTTRQKSPSSTSSEESISRPSYFSSEGSPILSHRISSSGPGGNVGLGATYAIRMGPKQSTLQTVIRNLVDNEDEDDRQLQRTKLENDLSVASERLDNLVLEHRDKLQGALTTFDAVDKKIKDSQEKIRQVKISLKACKALLRCKRDELKRLWLEDIKYKHMLQMLDDIEEVQSVPEKLVKFKTSKHYLKATELLKNSVARLEGELSSVEALKDLKQELLQEKMNLHEELIDELHRHLYVRATANRVVKIEVTSSKRATLTRSTVPALASKGKESVDISSSSVPKDGLVQDDLGVDPEEDSSHYMAVLVEALSILGRVQDAINAIQQRMEKEFLLIIERASIQVTHSYDLEEGHTGRRGRGLVRENVPKLLTRMLQSCFERFRHVVAAHCVLLSHFQQSKRIYKADYELYEEADVWTVIQQVVRNALEVYLAYDEENSSYDAMSGYAAFSSPGDAHSMFTRRKTTSGRVTNKPFFRFDSSRHAMSISSYMREQRDLELAEGGAAGPEGAPVAYEQDQPSISQHLVCKPHNRNITMVFQVVKNFVEVVEDALNQPGKHCSLHHFLHDYVERDFLERVRCEYFDKMSNCAKPEAARATAPDQKTMKVTGTKLGILNSVLTVWQIVEEMRQLMKDLPEYASNFLDILCQLLVGYKDSIQLLYKGLTTVTFDSSVGSGRHGGVVSAVGGGGASYSSEGVQSSKLAREESIKTRAKSLSSWVWSSRQQSQKGQGAEEDSVQSLYSKESEVLTAKIAEPLRKQDVILNHDSLRLLAILHESLDWFSGCLKKVVLEVGSGRGGDTNTTDGGGMSTAKKTEAPLMEDFELMEQFSSIQLEFQELAETIIIMLHLEVRCHCFYYLLPAMQKTSYVFEHEGVEEEKAVQELATHLKNTDLVMVAALNHDKYRYLFEGLGHLVAALFIASTHQLKTINTNGIKKMCRNISVLQSCLSKITLVRERELDRARKYFEMLYLNFDDIFEGIQEHGTQYSQEDYARAFSLSIHSNVTGKGPQDKEAANRLLQQQLQQLATIFSGDTV